MEHDRTMTTPRLPLRALRGNRTRTQRGYSLLEVTISFTLLAILASLVTSFALSGSDAQKFAERLSRVTEVTQELSADIREELQSSVRLFSNDALGQSYRDVLKEDDMPTSISAVLPSLDAAGIFDPETVAGEKTGNELLFARYAWTTEFETTAGNTHRIDIYRIVHYFLTEAGAGVQPNSAVGVNLSKFVSEPLVSGSQIDAINDPTDQGEVLLHLRDGSPDIDGISHPAAELVWDLGGDPTAVGTFRQIDASGALSDSPLAGRDDPWTVEPDARLSREGLLFYRRHSIASNNAPSLMQVARYSVLDEALGTEGFPHGFECQIVGPASARKVLLRLVITTTNNDGRKPYHALDLIADCRDI